MLKNLSSIVLLIAGLLFGINIYSEVKLPNIFSDNMVLQRNKPIAIWGEATAGEMVTVRFAGQSQTGTANTEGKWNLKLEAMEASAIPENMIIEGTNTLRLENILIGDVWICSGQSNMEYRFDRGLTNFRGPVDSPDLAMEELKEEKSEQIRYIYVEKKLKQKDIASKGWADGNDSIIGYISALGYFFAKEIHEEINIPIGIISTSWGGTMVEEWTPAWAYEEAGLKAYSGRPTGGKFESMMEPIIPFAAKGFLWYQGESNCIINDSLNYADKFKLMVDTWRQLWGSPDMPIYFVQIAPLYYTARTRDKHKHTPETLPIFWEAQEKCLQIPNTGMVVTTDLVDNLNDIHPSYKWIVGQRLALHALVHDYKRKLEYSGPVFSKKKIRKDKVFLSFDHTGKGLKSNDGKPLSWFSIAGENGNFVKAEAYIKKNRVIVSSADVKEPVHVRFGWNEIAQPNLFNKEGLPASPFRTDSPVWEPSGD